MPKRHNVEFFILQARTGRVEEWGWMTSFTCGCPWYLQFEPKFYKHIIYLIMRKFSIAQIWSCVIEMSLTVNFICIYSYDFIQCNWCNLTFYRMRCKFLTLVKLANKVSTSQKQKYSLRKRKRGCVSVRKGTLVDKSKILKNVRKGSWFRISFFN